MKGNEPKSESNSQGSIKRPDSTAELWKKRQNGAFSFDGNSHAPIPSMLGDSQKVVGKKKKKVQH